MSITVHERPGVYSSYDASSLVSGRGSGRLVGLAAVNTVAAPGETPIIPSYDRAVAAFGSLSPLNLLIFLLTWLLPVWFLTSWVPRY